MIYIKLVTLANLLNLEVVRVAFFANDELMSGEKIITNLSSFTFLQSCWNIFLWKKYKIIN